MGIQGTPRFLGVTAAAAACVATSVYAHAADPQFLSAGNRLLVETEGREDYSPRIVECDTSSIDLCLRDTRGTPANNPIEPAGNGNLTVTFDSWGISYEIAPDGSGITSDADGDVLGPFKWTMIPE